MNLADLIIFSLSIVGAIAGHFLLIAPYSWLVVSLCALFGAWSLFGEPHAGNVVVRLGGLSWSMEDFVRGWLITGRTGSGKTQSGINTITFQIFQNVKNWGGICLDQKGLYWEILVRMAAHFGRSEDLILLQTRPDGESVLWRSPYSINLTGNPDVPASTYAKVIVDTALSLSGGRGGNPFFPIRAQLAIQTAFEILRHLESYVTIPNIHRLLLNATDANKTLAILEKRSDQRSRELMASLKSYLDQPPEQLGGVQGTLSTYLEFFLNPEIAEVFCAEEPTFSVSEIDRGKIVCLAMPQKFQTERLYINTILKLSYYFHALSRFDKPAEAREKDNLLILFADEGQEIITGAESAFADHRAAGVIREARATIVLATQAYTSLLGSLDKRYADVLMLNLSNELIFTVANHDSAQIASKSIGEREVTEKSWGWSAGKRSYNYQTRIKPWFEAFRLRKLPRFTAIVCHCEKPYRKRLLPPITPEGSYPTWFTQLRPDYALRQWFQRLTS
ncbi:MAG: type IV secretion system DNA-binding domain-containing protein [Chthoniobacterales bacterium]|nr:type IV secretion system DNA-binding domain-containing protein [Chthoniobacterales bacterium]